MRRSLLPPLAALICAALLCGALGGCSREPQAGEGFRFPLAAEPRSLDPQTASDDAARTVIDNLFEGLCTVQNGVVVPAAADWSVSADGCAYAFTLRTSAWSSGDPVTADDFLFAYERTIDPVTASPYAAVFAGVTAVEAPDAHTLRVTLAAPDPHFLESIAEGAWYPCPRAFFAECGGGWGMEAKKSRQNGAFTLRSWEHDRSLLLRRNEQYHAADEIAPGAVRFVIGAEESVASLTDGTLDGCALPEGADTGAITVAEVPDTLLYLWFNTTVSPLNNAAVRRTLRDAIEWETVNAALPGVPSASYVSPAATWHGEAFASVLPPHTTVPDRAAFTAQIEAMGLSGCPTLTLLCADDADSVRVAQYIAQSWQKHYALYFTIEPLPSAKLTARVTAGNYHLAIAPATARGDSPADALLLFDGTAGEGNGARYQDATWAASVWAAESVAELCTAEQALAEACPAVPLAAVTRRFGFAADVSGVSVAPFTSHFDFRHAKR